MRKDLLLENVHAAKDEVVEAEVELLKLLDELEAVARAEKTTISEALRIAFEKLRSARGHLVTLEELAGEDDD